MSMTIEVDEFVVAPAPRGPWGLYLGAGIAWFLIGISILSWNPSTISLISFLVAGVVILAGITELVVAFTAHGWRWLHGAVGLLFLAAGVSAFMKPFQTFVGLAVIFGWYLLLKGMVVIIVSLATRIPGSLWGLGLFIGGMNLAIGLWAIGYPGRSAWLLVLWIGIGAILHGIADIITAFEIRAGR